MHTNNKTNTEIVELIQIKSAYNHYLASGRSLTEVENTTQIKQNRSILARTLNSRVILQEYENNKNTKSPSAIDYQYNEAEKNAILHFNKDKRFTITE